MKSYYISRHWKYFFFGLELLKNRFEKIQMKNSKQVRIQNHLQWRNSNHPQRCLVTPNRLQGGPATREPSRLIDVLLVESTATGETNVLRSTENAEAPRPKTDKCLISHTFKQIASETKSTQNSVKGKLKPRKKILEVSLKSQIFLMGNVESSFSKNNASAFEHEEFVSETIRGLTLDGCILEVTSTPHVVNPLSVNVGNTGKKRLILDLRLVNCHLFKEIISFDDWKSFKEYVFENGYAFKFDLKKGYHHLEIHKECQTLLGFSWEFANIWKYFVFTVLPFGLSSAAMIFTKLLRPLVSY